MIHLNVKIISRGGEKPQSAVASAAYRSGTKIYCEYDGEIKDFSRKGHVIYSEILLPELEKSIEKNKAIIERTRKSRKRYLQNA